MIQAPKKQKWATAGDLVKTFQFRKDANDVKLAVLSAVWEKEFGPMAKHWTISAVRKGILYVKPHSSAAAQELHMRAPSIIRSLNKHFSRAWIKAVKAAPR